MIRTRDYFVFLGLLLFLVSGISVSLLKGSSLMPVGEPASVYQALALDVSEGITTATVPPTIAIDRPARIASLRGKIAAGGGVMTAAAPELVPVLADSSDTSTPVPAPATDEPLPTDEVWLCSYYVAAAAVPLTGAQFKAKAGQRIIYRTERLVTEPVSTDLTLPEAVVAASASQEVVLVALPLTLYPAGQPSCIPQDIIGIALDGSYIRNNEYSAYRIFGSETLLGYALDGFPIHGVKPGAVSDRCGGVAEADSYRYYLSPERETMLNCFAGSPIRL